MEHRENSPLPPLPPEPKLEAMRLYLHAATLLHPEQIEKILAASIRSIAVNLAQADEALHQADYPALGRVVHTLKGTFLQCGLTDWAEKAQEIHSGVRAGQELPFAEMLAGLKRGMAPLLARSE